MSVYMTLWDLNSEPKVRCHINVTLRIHSASDMVLTWTMLCYRRQCFTEDRGVRQANTTIQTSQFKSHERNDRIHLPPVPCMGVVIPTGAPSWGFMPMPGPNEPPGITGGITGGGGGALTAGGKSSFARSCSGSQRLLFLFFFSKSCRNQLNYNILEYFNI